MTVAHLLVPDALKKGHLKENPQLCPPTENWAFQYYPLQLHCQQACEHERWEMGYFLFHMGLGHTLGCSYTANIGLLCLVQIEYKELHIEFPFSCAEDMELTNSSPSQTANRLRNKKSPFCLF